MFIVKRTTELNQTYDLSKLSFKDWPKEAQDMALELVSRNQMVNTKMRSLPAAERKEYLIQQIEKEAAFNPDDL